MFFGDVAAESASGRKDPGADQALCLVRSLQATDLETLLKRLERILEASDFKRRKEAVATKKEGGLRVRRRRK